MTILRVLAGATVAAVTAGMIGSLPQGSGAAVPPELHRQADAMPPIARVATPPARVPGRPAALAIARNIFEFAPAPKQNIRRASRSAATAVTATPPSAPGRERRLTLSGIAERRTAAGLVRTAIISRAEDVLLAGEGEFVLPGLAISEIREEWVVLTNLRTQRRTMLPLHK